LSLLEIERAFTELSIGGQNRLFSEPRLKYKFLQLKARNGEKPGTVAKVCTYQNQW
jgi:hypothetical protein